ncbi:hypothetical protein Tco_0266625 [Tanacetum coccineum]
MVLFGSCSMTLQSHKSFLIPNSLLHDQHGGFTLALLDSLFSKGLRIVNSITPKCRLGFSRVLKGALDKLVREVLSESPHPLLDVDEEDLDLGERNIKHCKRKICDGHYNVAVRVLSSSGVALYNDATLEELMSKHPSKPTPSLPHIPIDHHHLIASPAMVLDRIKSFPRGTSCGRDGLRAQHLFDCLSRASVAISDEVSAVMIGHSLDGYLDELQFGVGCQEEYGVKLLGGPASVDFDFSSELVMKRLAKAIGLMDAVAKINDPQCEFLLLCACTGISKRYFAMRTCSPRVFEMAQLSFDEALHCALERIVTASGPGFGDWHWRLATLPFAFGGLGSILQTKLLRYYGIVSFGPTFDDALCVFNTNMETDLFSNPSEIAALKLIKKLADIYFTRVTQTEESTFSLSHRQMALWKSQMEDHTSNWLRVVLISGLRQTMNGKTYRCVLCYRLGVPLFFVSRPCSACSRVFTGDIYGDHVVSCIGIIGIKHRHNVVRDALVDICFRSGISAGKEVDIGLDGGRDTPLRPADMLLYSWDEGLDVCVDLTGSSPLTKTGLADFGPENVRFPMWHIVNASKKDVAALLKRIRKFSVAQDIGARAAIHIFNRISFAITRGVGAQIVSRLPTNFLELEKDAVTLLKRIRRFSVTQDIGARTVVHIFNRIGVPLFSISIPCSACSRVFTGDIYGYHAVSCAGKEVDIGLDGGRDKPLRPTDMRLYVWDRELDVCVDLTRSLPLMQTELADFVPGRAMSDATHCKRVKYEVKCADIGYGFLPFSFSSFGELKKDVAALLKRIRKFSVAQDIGHVLLFIYLIGLALS